MAGALKRGGLYIQNWQGPTLPRATHRMGKKKKHIANKIMTVCLFNAWDVSSAGIERDTASLQQEV